MLKFGYLSFALLCRLPAGFVDVLNFSPQFVLDLSVYFVEMPGVTPDALGFLNDFIEILTHLGLVQHREHHAPDLFQGEHPWL